MAYINIASIQKKVNEYAKSPDGRKRANDYIDGIIHNDSGVSGRTDGGSYITTISDMRAAARLMELELIHEAQAAGLPDSVKEHIDMGETVRSEPRKVNGFDHYYIVDLTLEGDHRYRLMRPSLEIVKKGKPTGERTGDGIDNIVALFNNGYNAGDQVFGRWAGHEEYGIVGSRVSRVGLQFMQNAVRNFNRKYAHWYNVWAVLDVAYEKDFYQGKEE